MNKRFIPFIFAGILGFAAVLMLQHYLQQQRKKLDADRKKLLAQFQDQLEVVVAKGDLPDGKPIELKSLDRRSIPSKFIQPYATSDAREVVGLVPIAPIAAGEQILRNKLKRSNELTGSTLSALTPEGKRAVIVPVDPITASFVQPGDKVDLLWSFKLASGPPKAAGQKAPEEAVLLTLFQGVQVLAVNTNMGRPSAQPPAATPSNVPQTVTLALSANEASLVVFAQEQGHLQVSLRSTRDANKQQEAVQPATVDALMQAVLGPQQPVPEAPKNTKTVELYRGLQREVVTVDAQ